MWKLLARFILRFRAPILIVLSILTVIMGLFATKAKMKYDLSSAIPEDNPKYIEHQAFKKMFSEDGTMMVIGFDKTDVFEPVFFNEFKAWQQEIKKVDGVDNMLSIPTAINIKKQDTDSTSKLVTEAIFSDKKIMDSSVQEFLNLPFYKNLLYNPESHSYLTAIYLNKIKIKTAERIRIIHDIESITEKFSKKTKTEVHYSGLPFIRTKFSLSVQYEMKLILIASLLLTAIILLIFFGHSVPCCFLYWWFLRACFGL